MCTSSTAHKLGLTMSALNLLNYDWAATVFPGPGLRILYRVSTNVFIHTNSARNHETITPPASASFFDGYGISFMIEKTPWPHPIFG